MCQQLVSIGKAVGPELTASQLLDELFELLKDEEIKVNGGQGWARQVGWISDRLELQLIGHQNCLSCSRTRRSRCKGTQGWALQVEWMRDRL